MQTTEQAMRRALRPHGAGHTSTLIAMQQRQERASTAKVRLGLHVVEKRIPGSRATEKVRSPLIETGALDQVRHEKIRVNT